MRHRSSQRFSPERGTLLAAKVLIDGRSGSGKTELAAALATAWPEAQLVRLDDLYPGWDGLAAGSAEVPLLLTTHRWRSWDWSRNRPDEWHELDASRPTIVEGVGAVTAASRPLADFTVWVELDDEERKVRALRRDGETYAPHWERWAAQEDAFIARENPAGLVHQVVDGSDTAASALQLLPLLQAL